jgi:hypothetical protein
MSRREEGATLQPAGAWSWEPAHALEFAGGPAVRALAAGDLDADGGSVVWGCVGRELVRWGELAEGCLHF